MENIEQAYKELKSYCDRIENLLDKAYKAYNQDGIPQSVRAREVLRILGFTTGKRPVKHPCQRLLTEYQSRIAELSQTKRVTDTDKEKIINDMAERHNLAGYEAVHKKLRQAQNQHLNAIKKVYNYSPVLLKKASMQYRNIFPPHK